MNYLTDFEHAAKHGRPYWSNNALECARGLRLYAAKYHSEEKPKAVTVPDWNAIASKWTVSDDLRSQEVVA